MESDKRKHLVCCMAICIGAALVSGLVICLFDEASDAFVLNSSGLWLVMVLCGTWAAAGAAFGKEYGDKFNKESGWDNADLKADLAGILIGIAILTVINAVFMAVIGGINA